MPYTSKFAIVSFHAWKAVCNHMDHMNLKLCFYPQINCYIWEDKGFPDDSVGKESAYNAGGTKDEPWPSFQSLVQEETLEEEIATHSNIFA